MAIVVAFNVAFLAYVVFLMVFSFWPHVLSKLVFMGSVAFRLPFSSVCPFPTRFHGGYYSSCNFLSVLLLSCFLSVHFFQVSFLVCVIFKLVPWCMSPLGCFHGVCYLAVSRFWHVSLSFSLSLTGFFHGVFHLQVSTFLALYACSIVFITCIALIFLIVCCVCRC